MGLVAVTIKVMLESDADMVDIKSRISKIPGVREIKENDIGFGVKNLDVLLTMEDKGGGTDIVEKMISAIPGVASVETGDVTLL